MAVAGWRRGPEQGAIWGDLVGKTPTDRSKPETRSLLPVEESVGRSGAAIICHMLRMFGAGPP